MSTRIRTLVVDDEPIARARVVSLLKQEADIDLVGECATGAQALTAIERTHPDLVFLDIQMPEGDGLDLARTLRTAGAPTVVFVTAYDEYAVRAFEVQALDYLLKPFSAERFRAALGHAREQVGYRRQAAAAPSPADADAPKRQRLMIKSGGRIFFLKLTDIDWCDASGNYVRIHAGDEEYLIRETMASLETQLDPDLFVRIHRSTIVNVDRIQEMQSSMNGEYVVSLKNGRQLTLSRGYREALHARLGKPL